MENSFNMERIIKIIDDMNEKNKGLIPILQKLQNELGYLSIDILKVISEKMHLPYQQVFGVTTFYSQFRLEPQGESIIQLCDGTACHVRGSKRIIITIGKELSIKNGETSKDKKFTLEIVRCVGCCSLSPVIRIGENTYGRMDSIKMERLIKKHSKQNKK